jgi:dinuclear metal center YbgI/SA1388 family protein
MPTVASVISILDELAPRYLAEQWDNVGLLVGRQQQTVRRVMTCLTITPASASEAIAGEADLIVAHHPLPFHPLKRLTTESTAGQLLLDLIAASVAVTSYHTAFDSARRGINQRLAEGLELVDIGPLIPAAEGDQEGSDLGSGRHGRPPRPSGLQEMADRVKRFLGIERLQMVGRADQPVTGVAVACGSGGSFLDAACQAQCDCLVTGEAAFHTCLDAEARGVGLILPGHFASERFAVETLAETLAERFEGVAVWPSRQERTPLLWV